MKASKKNAMPTPSKAEAMRESGILEIGEIPDAWDVRKQRYAYSEVRSGNWGGEPEGGSNDVPCLRIGDFDRDTLRLKKQARALRASPFHPPRSRSIHVPALLLERAGGSLNVPVGKVVLYDQNEEAIASNFIVELEPKPQSDALFLLFQHLDLYLTGRVRRAASHTSGIQNLDVGAYLDELVAWPPADEQREIGAKLDALHNRHQRRNALLKRLHALLEERQLSESHHLFLAAAQGEQRRLSTLMEVRAGAILAADLLGNEGVPLVRLGDLDGDALNLEACTNIDPAHVPDSAWAHDGDVLVALSSRVGMTRRVRVERVAVNQRVAILRPKVTADAYLYAFLRSSLFREQLERATAMSVVLPNLAMSDLRNVLVPWPSAEERARIGDTLEASERRHRALALRIRRALTLYGERFFSIVHARVHGRPLNE